MSENRFKIVFDGTLLPGVDISTAKANLAALYKSEVTAVERLFSGNSVALKRDLSQNDAQAYLQALRDAGIDARIESEPSIEPNLGGIREPGAHHTPAQANVVERFPEYAALKPLGIEGRIGRLRFLAWSMVLSLVTSAVVAVFALSGLTLVSTDSTSGLIIGGILAFILCLVLLIAGILISVQRLHDIGWSGWLCLLSLVPFVGSLFPLLLAVLPGANAVNRYGAPPPPNSTAVKVLSSLWLVLIALVIVAAMEGGISAIQDEYENTLESSYQSGSITTDEFDVEAEPAANSTGDAAEQARPPVDSAQE